MPAIKKILLTGVSGFLGSHTAIQLLEKGYQVIGTVRDLDRAPEIRQILSGHTSNIDRLTFVQAELTDEHVWRDLMKGIDYVMHIASPFPRELPRHEDDLIRPAKQGTVNVLKAASQNGVNRIVITSSTAAIVYGKEKSGRNGIYNENDWTDISIIEDTTPYFRSKTIAERAAWDFIQADNSGLELSTICPGAILGPVLEKDFGTSANIVVKAMDGSMPAIPRIGSDMVDVRSVVDLHVRAMEMKEAAGERFIGSAGYLSFKEVTDILREKYPDKKIPRYLLPSFLVKVFSNFEPTLKPILLDLDIERRLDNSKAIKRLNWEPIDPKEAVIACAESVIEQEIL